MLKNNKHKISEEFYTKRLDDLIYRLGRIYEDGYFNYEEAKKCYFSSYMIEYRINDILEMSKTLHQIGLLYSSQNNITSAIKCFKKSIKLKQKCGYVGGIARTYYTMAGEIYRNDRKKLKQAKYYLRKAQDRVGNAGETELIYYINNLQGTIHMEKKKWNEAESLLKENVSNLEKQPHTSVLSTAYYNLARCEMRLKKYDIALERLGKNLKIVSDLGNKQRIFRNNQELALVYLLVGNYEKCYQHLSNNIDLLSFATNPERGHFFFYVALYYKKFNIQEYYKLFIEVSKQSFQVDEIVKDYYSLKRDFDKEIISDKTIILDKEKYLLKNKIEEIK